MDLDWPVKDLDSVEAALGSVVFESDSVAANDLPVVALDSEVVIESDLVVAVDC